MPAGPLVTLTTDFGDGSSYVAAMKGALLSVNPAARPLDLCHHLPPQDLTSAAYFLTDSLPWFPRGTIHVVVVDPGVGTGRSLLCVVWNRQHVLVPDNGCWTALLSRAKAEVRVYHLEREAYWHRPVSRTFHGRDILAPVAGHLSRGVPARRLGPRVFEWVDLPLPQPAVSGTLIRGQVVVVDRFGNLVSNIVADGLPASARVRVGGRRVPQVVGTYGEAEPGRLVALIGSSGRVEVAVVNGSAAAALGAAAGAPLAIDLAGR